MDTIFQREPTNAEKAGLILHLLEVGLPPWGEDENETLYWVFVALTGKDYGAAKRAYEDAVRFGMAYIKDDKEENSNNGEDNAGE